MPESQLRDSEYVTPGEASLILRLSTKQIARIADQGGIHMIRPGKHRRYLRSDIEGMAS